MTFARAVAAWLDALAPTGFDAERGEFEARGFIVGPSGEGKPLAGRPIGRPKILAVAPGVPCYA